MMKAFPAYLPGSPKEYNILIDIIFKTFRDTKKSLSKKITPRSPHEICVASAACKKLWSEEMAEACVYLMERINFEDVISDASLRGGTTKQSHQQEIATLSTVVRNDVKHYEIRNTHINIGTGKEISIKNLAELIKEKTGFKGELYFNTEKPDGTLRKLTDVTKLHNLGWHHKIEIEEGVEKMYGWYVNQE